MKLGILLTVAILILASGIFLWYFVTNEQDPMSIASNEKIEGEVTYVSIGDSYTIGNGVAEEGRWPNVLTKHLDEAGINVRLIGNPAVSGYTVEDALRQELPVVKHLKPDFVTVLIGANDNFSQTDPRIYERELAGFLDELQKLLEKPENIILITIPDYSKSPAAAGYDSEGISTSIEEYNEIIKAEAGKRKLQAADIFEVSQTMTGAEDYISDGLHPSVLGYAKWEKVIYPLVYELLKK